MKWLLLNVKSTDMLTGVRVVFTSVQQLEIKLFLSFPFIYRILESETTLKKQTNLNAERLTCTDLEIYIHAVGY